MLSWHETLRHGFDFEGTRVLFTSRAAGIFKPKVMTSALSFAKAPKPRKGREMQYIDDGMTDFTDGADVRSDEPFPYDFQRNRPHFNRYMFDAHALDAPLIYFYGVKEGWYRPLWPAFIDEVDQERCAFRIVVQLGLDMRAPQLFAADPRALSIERRYATIETKKRLHQDLFRQRVLAAYQDRCAICRLPRRELLEAAHILADRDERGRPEVPNGLSLCSLHHGAFDADLLGITPAGVIEIAKSLQDAQDGPTLEHGLKGFHGKTIHSPHRNEDRPRPDYLQIRYEQFRKAS